MPEPDFKFARKDFRSCTRRKADAQYLHSRFKTLMAAITGNTTFTQNFDGFKVYVGHPFNRGSLQWNDYAWLGTAPERHGRPQDQVQFQVSISRDNVGIQVWVDHAARLARQKVKRRIIDKRAEFVKELREQRSCSVGILGPYEFRKDCERINKADIDLISQKIGDAGVDFFISRDLQALEAIRFGGKIISEILYTWLLLRPLYDLMASAKVRGATRIPTTAVSGDGDITRNLGRLFPTREIDLNETEAQATERESKQILYEMNWRAQEKATSSHRKAVILLAKYLRRHGVKPKQSVVDALGEGRKHIFIFEVKSIHTHNFIHQTRAAIGQLLDYEYYQVKHKPENKGKEVSKGIVYTRKPPRGIIDFLKSLRFFAYWIEGKKISGTSESMKELARFASGV